MNVTFTFKLTLAAILAGMVALGSKASGLLGVLFFTPFSLGPLFVTLLLATCLATVRAQITLCVSSVVYCAYFAYMYADIFYIHIDPQSAVGLLFVGVFSLPVMAVFWIVAGVLQSKSPQA